MPDLKPIERAAEVIRAGGLVIVPTETVYGVAADALNPAAVTRIFSAKGRPASHPLIVHVASWEQAKGLVMDPSPVVEQLADAFWPGPLTLILKKSGIVPDEVTGGLDTVALRVPNHPEFLKLLELVGPCAAPSANLFTKLSATRFADLDPELLSRCDFALDGGTCEVGIESTVLDLATSPAQILRPGRLTPEQLAPILGFVPQILESEKSPGNHPEHYRPKTPVHLVDRIGAESAGISFSPSGRHQFAWPTEPDEAMQQLYAFLHELDRRNFDSIEIEIPPEHGAWDAIMNRLRKLAQSTSKVDR